MAGLRSRLFLLLGLGLLAGLAVVPAAPAAIPREPAASTRMDLWTGWWVPVDPSDPFIWILRQLPDGRVIGHASLPNELLDPAQLELAEATLTGTVDPATGVVTAVLLSPGDPSVTLRPGPVDFRSFTFASGPLEGTYEYAGFGPHHATVDLDWTKSNFRRGQRARFPAYAGDVVRMSFDLTNAGPRGVPRDHVSLVIVLPAVVGNGATVKRAENAACTRSTTASSVLFRCRVAALGPGSNEASVVIDVKVPAALAGKVLRARARISTGAPLDPALDVNPRPRAGALLAVKVRNGKAPPGGGSGGGGGGSGGGGSQTPALTPVTEALMKALVCVPETVTIQGAPHELFSWGGYNPDIGLNFSCNYRLREEFNAAGSIQAHYTRVPGGVNYCRHLNAEGLLSRTRSNVEVYVPPWFDDADAIRSALLARLEEAGIALPCP